MNIFTVSTDFFRLSVGFFTLSVDFFAVSSDISCQSIDVFRVSVSILIRWVEIFRASAAVFARSACISRPQVRDKAGKYRLFTFMLLPFPVSVRYNPWFAGSFRRLAIRPRAESKIKQPELLYEFLRMYREC